MVSTRQKIPYTEEAEVITVPQELPVLSGVATQDLVEHIGTGSYKASYINWSRTMDLLRKNAPGWMVEIVRAPDGDLLHRASVGAEMMLRFRHIDGTVTTDVPQAVMDHRNNSIPFDKITSRDITDTHRRGACMAAAFLFGLAYELWAKMPLESGYQVADEGTIEKARQSAKKETKAAPAPQPEASTTDESQQRFLDLAKKMGLCEPAITDLVKRIKGDFSSGLKTLQSKDDAFVEQMNKKFLAAQY